MIFKENDVVLFQGDSITDCGRNYEDSASLGFGYPLMVASRLGYLFPEKNLVFVNRGISGNRAIDLKNRWDRDCLDLKPTWVSILIGINDTWRRYDRTTRRARSNLRRYTATSWSAPRSGWTRS
ncbi:hypothetical protein HMSSN036_79040 [Paenibacillus macerans]|nr:hypothetical protein HMSSN036_79040 [Paenibacillus macerans]